MDVSGSDTRVSAIGRLDVTSRVQTAGPARRRTRVARSERARQDHHSPSAETRPVALRNAPTVGDMAPADHHSPRGARTARLEDKPRFPAWLLELCTVLLAVGTLASAGAGTVNAVNSGHTAGFAARSAAATERNGYLQVLASPGCQKPPYPPVCRDASAHAHIPLLTSGVQTAARP